MPADDRRASIIRAALPLLRKTGAAVTTKEVAVAAGIAEGTLFRVFPTTDALIEACVANAFDTATAVAGLCAIDRDLPLEHRLTNGVEVMREHVEGIIGLISVLHATGVQLPRPSVKGKRRPGTSPEVDAAFVDLVGPDAERLRFPVQRVITFLSMLTLASAHPMLPDHGATAADVVDLLLHGALDPSKETSPC
jgi:AcrR family transcriptional regulator